MKRTEITEIFPEATAEQVEAIMKLHGKGIADVETLEKDLKATQEALATAKAEDKSKELKDAQKALATTQAELNSLKAANALRDTREKVAAAKGIPAHLLTGETEEACAAQADAILAFAKTSDYPPVADGGEPTNTGGDAWTAFSAQLSKN